MNEQMKKGMMDTQSKSYQNMSEDPQGQALGNMLAQYQQGPAMNPLMPVDPNDPNNPLLKKQGLLSGGSVNPPAIMQS